jgi:hypothetical protein
MSLFTKQQQQNDDDDDDDDLDLEENDNKQETPPTDESLKQHLNKLKNDNLFLNKYITIVPIDKEAPSSDW